MTTPALFRTIDTAALSRRTRQRMIRNGTIIRVRRGRYVAADLPDAVVRAARLGGRLDCVSLLREVGVFVARSHGLHLQVEPHASRLPHRPKDVRAHWRGDSADPTRLGTDLVGAIVQAVRCQSPRDAVATLDSALHLGLLDEEMIGQVFAALPDRWQRLRALVDGRAESGIETLVRLMLRGIDVPFEVQVRIPGVGRVDLLVAGRLIIECDSRAFHGDVASQRRDRARDLAAAARGYVTLRLLAEDVLFRPEHTLAALRGAVSGVRRGQVDRNSGVRTPHRGVPG
ncbi:hypothetical protein RR49_02310 [Microbacterium ginsengisoli]|uniref:DUF559 domain-containing protein n=2 Tax=Microbacterium TaxID=33882 RepID=A0A0F0LVT6_9MICO|nr:hypothetical protein [Microbacterium ginsengisoli]KJL35551.1 hypothetical protein RR49_02310 [Microbacterium ginsengisoli]